MERGEMGGMHEGAKKMYVLKEQLKAVEEGWDRAFKTLDQGKDAVSDTDLDAAHKNLIEAETAARGEYESLAGEMSAEHKAKFAEWNRLVEQEETLLDDVEERLASFTAEEYLVVLGQMKDVHERRKKLAGELDQIFESLES